MVVNKYNIHWQIIRVKAKSLKNYYEKVDLVLKWYKGYPSKFNYERVKKWLIMSEKGYKLQIAKDYYKKGLRELESHGSMLLPDQFNQFEKYTESALKLVHTDLRKRNYAYFGTKPKDHINFMYELEHYLNNLP